MNVQRLLTSILLVLAIARAHGEGKTGADTWRCPANGGINALYCYLRVHAVKDSYEVLRSEQAAAGNPQDAAALARLARRHGVALQPVSLTLNELKLVPKPIVVHVDGETPEAGTFILLLAMNDRQVEFINGPSATFQSLRVEDFLRVWSGVALLPPASPWRNAACCGAGFGAGLLLASAIRWIHFSNNQS